jgi:hypothetical protein
VEASLCEVSRPRTDDSGTGLKRRMAVFSAGKAAKAGSDRDKISA